MRSTPPLDCAGRRRSPATMSGFHQGRPPRNKGLRYPPDPPTVEEIMAAAPNATATATEHKRHARSRSRAKPICAFEHGCFGLHAIVRLNRALTTPFV